MTRLESSARDYAIACIARGLPPESLLQFADEYSRAVQEVADEERARRRDYAPLPGAFADRVAISRNCTAYARRLVRARVALYLRLLRRVEAWERGAAWWAAARESDTAAQRGLRAVSDLDCSHVSPDDWAIPPAAPRTEPPPFEEPLSTWTKRYEEWARTPLGHAPWRPLWTAATPYQPGVTARRMTPSRWRGSR